MSKNDRKKYITIRREWYPAGRSQRKVVAEVAVVVVVVVVVVVLDFYG